MASRGVSVEPREPGMPRVNRQIIGYFQLNKKDDPEAFKSPEELARDTKAYKAYREAAARHDLLTAGDGTALTAASGVTAAGDDVESDEEDEPLLAGVDDDPSGDYMPGGGKAKATSKAKGKGKAKAVVLLSDEDDSWTGEVVTNEEFEREEDYLVADGESVTSEDTELGEGEESEEGEEEEEVVPADALAINDPGWKRAIPKSQPLTYYIHADAAGGVKAKKIAYEVDFNDRESVNKANKTRRLEVNRSKARHGINAPLRRPSTKGREYTAENDQAIKDFHEDWAKNNNGQKIPAHELTALYNRRFRDEHRSKNSLTSHMDRVKELKDMRNSYSAS